MPSKVWGGNEPLKKSNRGDYCSPDTKEFQILLHERYSATSAKLGLRSSKAIKALGYVQVKPIVLQFMNQKQHLNH